MFSSEHASIRWNGQGWTLKDLGSRNQTYRDGAPVAAEPVALGAGNRLAFGREADTWTLLDTLPPEAVAVPLDGGEPLVAVNALLPVPSSLRPAATIYRGSDGGWKVDEDGETREIADGGVLEIYQDELCSRLRIDVLRLNVDVYRIRKQFAQLDLLDPATVVERRARTKQVRLGVKRFVIEQG